jgi:hypothetical protein
LYHNDVISQEIKGKITDTESNPLSNVAVIIKDSINSNTILAYTFSNSNGNYSVKTGNLNSFIIAFQSLSYVSEKIAIGNFSEEKNPYLLDIFLKKDLTELEEIFIKTKKPPITIKKDTIVYNPESFRDGTERVVEDLIKNLPGMRVEADGKITFKGTLIETVLLDGDDLFSENYIIGTKNIDVDMVESVAAIENYIKNPLLHGIANTTAVAINLTLKEGNTDYSGTANLGGGIENRADVNGTVLGISKKLKSFSTVSYNNTGKEYSPYDYFSQNRLSIENTLETDFKLPKIISDYNFASDVSEERSRINSNLFASLNSIYNISDRMGAKVNFDFKNDRLKRATQSLIEYFNIAENIAINQQESLVKKPELYNFKLDLNYKLSGNELIEYKTRIKNEDINTSYDINLNDTQQMSLTNSYERQLQQVINYTKRINPRTALISNFLLNKSSLSQNLFITPELRFQNKEESGNQTVAIEKIDLNLSAYLLNSGQGYNLKIGLGYTSANTKLYSLLTGSNHSIPFSENNFKYKNSFPWVEGNLFFRQKKWNFRTEIKINYLQQELEDYTTSSNDKQSYTFQFLPNATITYNLNKIENFRLLGSYRERLVNESLLYENVIFTSSRGGQSNISGLETIKNYSLDLSYNHNDFFNLFQFSSGINYTQNLNSFFNIFNIDNLFVINKRELLNLGFDDLSVRTNLDRYVSFLKSNIKLNLSYGRNTYKNRINDSEIRNNVSNSGFSSLILKTGFLGITNFENNLQYGVVTFKTDNFNTIYNSSLQNSFKVYIKPTQRIQLITGFDYYLPNINASESFIFFDTSLNISSNNQRINYAIVSKNISPKKNSFSRTDISDFSSSITSYNLNTPYILFSVNFKF